jgi:uncharacterized protein (DUF983 family)
MSERASAGPVSPVSAGLAGRCPRCGRGALFDGVLKVTDRCVACGLDFRTEDSADGPAVFVIFVLGAVVATLALVVEAWAAPPLWLHALIWPPVVLLGAVAMLRPLKGIFIGLHYKHNLLHPDGGA